MRVVRRASLVLGVVLIVAIAVGYVSRTSEMERARDLRLVNDAEVAASELAALVDTVTVAADAGRAPRPVADALATVVPDHGVCVISPAFTSCAGDGTMPSEELIAELERSRRNVAEAVEPHPARVTVYERRVTITANGPALSVVVELSIGPDATVWPTTFLPSGADANAFFDDGNLRQTAVPVPGATGVFVVAATEHDVALPSAEHLFYAVVFALSLVLLVLAGVTLVVEHRSLVERASFDRLTQLPNRSEFERRVEAVFATDEACCLLVFDLDGFKKVNDTYGHHVGDEVLKVIARRLRGSVRDRDVVARWGGDEFVVLLPGVSSAEMGARRARHIAEEVGGRTRIDGLGESLRVRTSVGVALWPEHGRDLDALVAAADRAMYEAKRSGTVTQVCAATGDPGVPGRLVSI